MDNGSNGQYNQSNKNYNNYHGNVNRNAKPSIEAFGQKNYQDSAQKNYQDSIREQQYQVLEEYEKEVKIMREELARLRKVEEEKIKLDEDVKRIQSVHSQMDIIIEDLKNKAKLTDQLKTECLNLASENGQLRQEMIILQKNLDEANTKLGQQRSVSVGPKMQINTNLLQFRSTEGLGAGDNLFNTRRNQNSVQSPLKKMGLVEDLKTGRAKSIGYNGYEFQSFNSKSVANISKANQRDREIEHPLDIDQSQNQDNSLTLVNKIKNPFESANKTNEVMRSSCYAVYQPQSMAIHDQSNTKISLNDTQNNKDFYNGAYIQSVGMNSSLTMKDSHYLQQNTNNGVSLSLRSSSNQKLNGLRQNSFLNTSNVPIYN